MNTSTPFHSRNLECALDAIDSSVAGMADEQMTWTVDGKWSSVQLLEHLALAFLITVKASRMVLRQAKPDVRQPSWKERLKVLVAVNIGFLPSGAKAPRMVIPKGMSPQEARNSISSNLLDMDKMLQRCEEKFGSDVGFLVHGFLGPLTIGQWRKFHLVHTRHHMKQIHKLRRQMAHVPFANSEAAVGPAPA
jgi:preprotein translocase subunit Sss1